MSGATPELALGTAVDADDTADYLTLTLANSLRTIDALFNNVTGHNHSGAHQGGPMGNGIVGTNQLADGSVNSAKIADLSIVGNDIADRTIPGIKLTNPLADNLYLANSAAVQWGDANSRISSISRSTYFDEYNGGWGWRNSAASFSNAMLLDGAGNATLAGRLNFTGVDTALTRTAPGVLHVTNDVECRYLAVTSIGVNGAAVTAGGYVFITPNAAGPNQGSCIAYSFANWASVDHATEYELPIAQVGDPISKLQQLHPVYYAHASIDPNQNTPQRNADGTIETFQTYGMSPKQVASVLPELVGPSVEDPQGIDYARLAVVLWAACQVMEQRISTLEGAVMAKPA